TGVGKLLKEVCQVNKGVGPVLLRCLDDAVDYGAGASASGRVGEQPVLPPDDKRLDGAFRPVVVDLEPAVFQKRRQFLPLVEAVAHRLAQGALGKGLCLLLLQPGVELVQDRRTSLLSGRMTRLGIDSLEGAFGPVETIAVVEALLGCDRPCRARRGRRRRDRLVTLPTGMRPASHPGDVG